MRRSARLLPLSLVLSLAACGDDAPLYFPIADVAADTGSSDADGTDTGTTDTAIDATDTATDASDTDTATDTDGTDTDGTDTDGTDTAVDTGDTDAGGCDDADEDGVCDDEDICPSGDDTVDTDEDGVPDDCDVCAEGPDDLDTDEDGTPDACDLCADSDDAVDTDEDGVPDGCDVCAGEDDTADADEDGVPDACDVCPEWDDAECAAGCAGSARTAYEGFGGGVVGCSGTVQWSDRDTLCGEGFYAATGEEWVGARGEAAPTYHYWTDQDLRWDSNDDNGECSVAPLGEGPHDGECEAGPMRVCVGDGDGVNDSVDPLGNTCTWTGCGWGENEPQEYFGGCSLLVGEAGETGDEAGTLCVARTLETFDVVVLPDPTAQSRTARGRIRGNVYLADVDAVLYGFDQRHESAEFCDLDVYVWSTPSIEDPTWRVLHASTSNVGVRGASYAAGASNLHINIEAGTYYAFGIGWTCAAENAWNAVDAPVTVGFGETAGAYVFDNVYMGFDPGYLPADIQTGDTDTYPQHVTVYGLE